MPVELQPKFTQTIRRHQLKQMVQQGHTCRK